MLLSDYTLGNVIEKVCPRDVEMKRKVEHSEDAKKSSEAVKKEYNCNSVGVLVK